MMHLAAFIGPGEFCSRSCGSQIARLGVGGGVAPVRGLIVKSGAVIEFPRASFGGIS